MKVKILSVVVLATWLFSGCNVQNAMVSRSGAPFYLAYDADTILRNQSEVATVTSVYGLEIDGIEMTPKNMRVANYGFFKSQTVVADILPGEHLIKITHAPGGGYVSMNPIKYYFEAGRIYNVYPVLMIVKIKENKSAQVAQKIAENRKNAVFEQKN